MTQVIEIIGGEYRNRTGVHGFAIRCVTTPPTRRRWWLPVLTHSQRCRKCDISSKTIPQALPLSIRCVKRVRDQPEQNGLVECQISQRAGR